jgi:hypothetical protein
MKLRAVTLPLVALYVVFLFLAGEDAEASGYKDRFALSEWTPFIELGSTVYESHNSVGGFGLAYKNKYQITRKFSGEGVNKYNAIEPRAKLWTIDRIIVPGWFNGHYMMIFGLAHLDQSRLIAPYNFHLAVGWQWKSGKFYFEHFSSADVNEKNTGVNMLALRINL